MASVSTTLRQAVKKRLVSFLTPTSYFFDQPGFCPCCENQVVFYARHPWLRDSFQCPQCACIPRERALMLTLERTYPMWRNLAIHESSPGVRGASVRLKKECAQYVASQYFPQHPFGSTVQGFSNQNLEQQTFADNSFDLVVTQDVFEHIYNPAAAFAEIARTLKPGGAHIFTVPLINRHAPTQVWATLNPDGSANFLFTPEVHGNPVDPENGSPVTMHWGYDIVQFIEQHSGLKTEIVYLDELEHGIGGEFREVLVSRNPS